MQLLIFQMLICFKLIVCCMTVQEQAAALLNQLHQQDPGRVDPPPHSTPRPALPRQSLLLTPGMGSVGSVSPCGGGLTTRGHNGLAGDHW